MRVVFDIETDGLLYEGTKIWCITALDLNNKELLHWTPTEIEEGLDFLYDADVLVGHNISGFDLPFIEKNYQLKLPLKKCRDTYVMSKLFYPERPEGHSLESWAPLFGKEKVYHEDWSEYSEEMRHRNEEDVNINALLYEDLVEKECRDWKWLRAIRLEQEMHYWQAWQEVYGVDFDVEKADELLAEIDSRIADIDKKLYEQLPMRVVQVGTTVTKPFKKDGTYTKNVIDWFSKED